MVSTQPQQSDYNTYAADAQTQLLRIISSGSVVELRILGKERGISSGYYNDLGALVRDAATHDGKAAAVYFTFNPCNPDLLARANNRLREWVKSGETTRDEDITMRRAMFVDVDSVRPSGIPATRDEHMEAIALAGHINSSLTRDLEFPEPISLNSGNGAYLLYLVDLPNDEVSEHLIKRCVQALAHSFNHPGAIVDVSTYNASRLMRLPGTMNRKGDQTEDRRYRRCDIAHMPDRLEVVPIALLENLASMEPSACS